MMKEVHLLNKNEETVEDLKVPYQIFGESLATVSVLTLRGYKVSSQQASNLMQQISDSFPRTDK